MRKLTIKLYAIGQNNHKRVVNYIKRDIHVITMNSEEEVEESTQQVGSGRGQVVRVTIVMPSTMYDAIKSGADSNYQLVGEFLRDRIRNYLDEQNNLVQCEGKDCEAMIDGRLDYCPYCGEETPETEDENEDENEDEE